MKNTTRLSKAVLIPVLLVLLAGQTYGAGTFNTFDQVPYLVAQDLSRWAALISEGDTRTVRIALFGDSQETAPGGGGVSYMPALNFETFQHYGNAPETLIEPMSQQQYAWLMRASALSSTGFDRGVKDLPNQDISLLPTGPYPYLGKLNPKGENHPAALPPGWDQTIFRTDGVVKAQIIGLTKAGSANDVYYQTEPMATAFTPNWFQPVTGSGTIALGLDQTGAGEFQFVSGTTDALNFNGLPYMQLRLASSEAGKTVAVAGYRFFNETYPSGMVFNDFSKGGVTLGYIVDNFYDAGDMFNAFDFDAAAFHFGANESGATTAAQFKQDALDAIAMVRGWVGDPNYKIILFMDPDRLSIFAPNRPEYDEYPGAYETIAQADPNVLVVNSRRLAHDNADWYVGSPVFSTYTGDGVHYAPLGARTLAGVEMDAFFSILQSNVVTQTVHSDISGPGSVSPSADVVVATGQTAQVFYNADPGGNVITSFLTDGVPVPAALGQTAYTSTHVNVQADITNTVVFAEDLSLRTIHSDLTGPGSVAPSANLVVTTGTTAQVFYTADPNYLISSFLTDGVSVPAAIGLAAYTSTHVNVQAHITNTVTFTVDPSLRTIHSELSGPGSVSPSANVLVTAGQTAQVIYTANAGNEISSFLTDGVFVPAATGQVAYTSTHVNVQSDITNTVVYVWDGTTGGPGTLIPYGDLTITSSGYYPGGDSYQAFNGDGLTGDDHNNAWQDSWLSDGGTPVGEWIKVDLGGVRNLARLRVWNMNQSGLPTRGIAQADIYVAMTDPGNNVDGGANSAATTGNSFNPLGWTLALADQAFVKSPGTASITNTDEHIDLGGIEAAFLAIRVNSSHGDSYVGVSEVQVYEQGGGAPTYALTVNSGSGDGNYTESAVVNITADGPPAGKEFDAWTGDVGAVANVNVSSTTVTMPAAATTVTATYKDIISPTYTLTVNSGTGDGNYTESAVVNISADAPPSGQVFDQWTGDTSGIASVLAASTTLTMPAAATTVTATYKSSGSGGGEPVMLPYTNMTITSSTYFTGADDDGAFNGDGLTGDSHNNNYGDMWLPTPGPASNHWLKVALGGTYNLDHLRVWNYNQSDLQTRGIQNADIYVALTDPGHNVDQSGVAFNPADWTLVTADQYFNQATFGGAPTLNTDTNIALNGVEAAYLAIRVKSNHGFTLNGGDVGVSEIQIYAGDPETDHDGDGLPTDWENPKGLDPNDDGSVDPDQGADGDPDLDGATNYEELIADTHPNDSNSVFVVTDTAPQPDGSVDVTVDSSAARVYLLQGSSDVSAPLPWPVLQGPTAGTGGAMTFNDATATGSADRAYAVEVRMP